MIDTHCHLFLEQFNFDLEDVIRDADEIGVHQILVPGIDSKTSVNAIKLAQKYQNHIYAAVGIHPNYSVDSDLQLFDEIIRTNIKHIYAIGEIGLDYFRDYAPHKTQIKVLEKQLDFAEKYNLPICLHNRNAEKDLIEILDERYIERSNFSRSGQNGVFHAYDGSEDIADWGKDHAFAFGIGGLLTYKKSSDFRGIVKQIGLEFLVVETDAPYSSPIPYRGKRNVPKYLELIISALAELFDCSEHHVEEMTDRNANHLFSLKKKCQ